MKIRMIALAGVAALALAGPASASDATGWYLGLGAGWDNMGNYGVHYNMGGPINNDKYSTSDTALFVGSVGYKFNNHIRLEGEIGYDSRTVGREAVDGDPVGAEEAAGSGGHMSITSAMLNAAYDIPLSERWDFSIGGGLGVGADKVHNTVNGTLDSLQNGREHGFMWQGIAGLSYSLNPHVDLTLDYRYRGLEVDHSYGTSFVHPVAGGGFASDAPKLKDLDE